MEIFDVVDQNGMPTGETVERKKAHAEGIPHRTAHIWIIREKDGKTEVLLQKRAKDKDSFPGCYDTSSAGHIQAGDEPKASALRELEEELGISAMPEDLETVGTFPINFEQEFYGKMFRDKEVAFVFLYRKEIEDRAFHLQEEEVEAVDWFEIEYAYQQCLEENPRFCIPIEGLALIREYIKQ